MEAIEEAPLGSKEPSQIIKGKRTKRIRPQSPPPVSITANSSAAEGDIGECYNNHRDKYDVNSFSPATETEEDEDMANCLILLAQGPARKDIVDTALTEDEDGGTNYAKYSSRKFMEAAALGSGKDGYYVYECKTCNRTFPSFQALGGHRASHKKLKTVAMDNEEEFQFKNKIINNNNSNNNPFSLQLNSRGNLQISKNSKVHECAICGAEFTSGQALGGHMRRHRAPVAANTTLLLNPVMPLEAEDERARKRGNIVSLDLDLNLPAPEDDQRELKFGFVSKQQQQQQQPKQPQQQANLVFTASSLVDCHY